MLYVENRRLRVWHVAVSDPFSADIREALPLANASVGLCGAKITSDDGRAWQGKLDKDQERRLCRECKRRVERKSSDEYESAETVS